MSITINTSEYVKVKNIKIDDVEFEFRPATVAQSLALSKAQENISKGVDVAESVDHAVGIMFDCFSPADKARELLGGLSFEALGAIFSEVSNGE